MAAWSRIRTSYSSLPTTSSPSSSTPSSSASLCPPLLLELADDLWFYSSVVPLPSLSLPCLPALFSPPSPDPSTLIAQCMITHFSPSPRLPLPSSSSSSSSPTPPPDSQPQTHLSPWGLPAYHALPAPPDNQENYANTFSAYDENAYRGYNETAYGGYSSLSDSDEDDNAYQSYPCANAGEDEEAYHYYTATSDWDDEDVHHAYHVPSDCEDEQQVHAIKEEVLLVDPLLEPDDALSGIYDVGVLLKDQHQKGTQEVSYSRFQREAASLVSVLPQIQVPSRNEQGDMKENIKLWAHAVASTLPWKAAAQARPLL